MWNIVRIILSVVDIAIVSYGVYRLILLLKSTRAMLAVKGVLILAISYLVSGWLHLESVHWVLGKSWSVLLVGIALIFQPELRSILERLGRGSRFCFGTAGDGTRTAAQSRMVQEISEMLAVSSRQKTGVLLVLEGSINLGVQITTGIPVDAEVSKELLMNLYFKNSPLHDGAVIIRDGRIAAAGCILPLTADDELDSSFGTRHRSAIGISETTDALVFVVSEETGAISIVRHGMIQHGVGKGQILKAFDDFYGVDSSESRAHGRKFGTRLRRRRRPHGTWLDKGISLLIAVLLWLYVTDFLAQFPLGS